MAQDKIPTGRTSRLQRKEVVPMAEYLINAGLMIVAGVAVALIVRLFGLNK